MTRDLLRSFTPPLIWDAVRTFRNLMWRSSPSQPVLEWLPNGWESKEIQNTEGWNLDRVIQVEEAKWPAFCHNLENGSPLGFSHEHTDLSKVREVYFHNIHMTFAYVLALVARQKKELAILDVGGGLGHYYMLGKSVIPDLKLHYYCKEVSLMCDAGKRLCPEVEFCCDDSCFQREYDLVMINGSLGYFRNWEKILSQCTDVSKGHLFITRILTDPMGDGYVALQRTDVYKYHSQMIIQVLGRKKLLDIIQKAGFHLVREVVVGGSPPIAGAPVPCMDEGWLFSREK